MRRIRQSIGGYSIRSRGRLSNSSSPSFNPASIAGLYAWYDPSDAASLSTTGANVNQMNDKSGNSRHLLASSSTRPQTGIVTSTLGKNMLDFDGADDYMDTVSSASLSQPATLFIIAKADTATNGMTLATGKTIFNGEHLFRRTSDKWASYAGLEIMSAAAASTNQIVHCVVFNTTSSEYYLNGTLDASGNVFTNTCDGFRIGSRPNASGFFNGAIGEIIRYNAVLSSTDRDAVNSYLAAKW